MPHARYLERSFAMTSNINGVTPLRRLRNLVELSKSFTPPYTVAGSVTRINQNFVYAAGLSQFVTIDDAVAIAVEGGELLGEVSTVDGSTITIVPLNGTARIELGTAVRALHGPLFIRPDPSWRGRVLDPIGEPVDRLGPVKAGPQSFPLHGQALPAMTRGRLGAQVATGIKAIDLFVPICSGQRMGIFAGSGVGKSTLLAMLGRVKAFDTIVLGLVGERGREVRDFLDDTLAQDRSRIVAVVATSDESPMMRRLAPSTAMTVAEFFRDKGERVLLVLDSVTRYAHAIRELAGAFDEVPVARGFPPSTFSSIPRLLERAGPGRAGGGSITAFVSVLVDGDDHNEPISDAVRGVLDGHVVLDRSIAAQGRFPAIDPLRSISRLASKIRTREQETFTTQLLELISCYEETRDLRMIGGYHAGNDPLLDRAVELVPRLYDSMRQDLKTPPVDDVYSYLGQALAARRS